MVLKQKVLKKLREVSPCFLSGESLAQGEGVSRAAVWKAVLSLRKNGYRISGSPRRGYRLVEPPDLLTAHEVEPYLRTKVMGRVGYHHFKELSSTNDKAKILAAEGCAEGTLVVAEAQTAGRGRLGRSWHSPLGSGLYFSLILRPDFAPHLAPRITLLGGVALCLAIRELTGVKAGIKWPNDVMVRNRKVGGILTEMEAEADAIHHLILGFGVNINMENCDLPAPLKATSLMLETGKRQSRAQILARILWEVEESWNRLLKEGFGPIADAWRHMSVTLGRLVGVETEGGVVVGRAKDIDEQGALLLTDQGGHPHRVTHGEVLHVR